MKKSEKKSFITAGVSFPKDLYAYAQRQAAKDDRSLSYYIQSLIKKDMKNKKSKQKPPVSVIDTHGM